MSSPVVDVFVEDRGHEAFVPALISRLAREGRHGVRLHIRTARGGHPRVLEELSRYQRVAQKGLGGIAIPDLLLVAIDANCDSHQGAVRRIEEKLDAPFKDRAIIACPDPHIELWYMADLESFAQVVGIRPRLSSGKCERDYYKKALAKAVVDAGHAPTLGGIEFARELVEHMDFYRAGKAHRSLGQVIQNVRTFLKTVAG